MKKDTPLTDWTEEELLTACIWAEARDQGATGMVAVGHVVLNRITCGMAKSIHECILKPRQFSWTSTRDPNYSAVLAAATTAAKGKPPARWNLAKALASQLLAGEAKPDPTVRADHYLNIPLTRTLRGGTLPAWVEKAIRQNKITVTIRDHTFFRLVD